MTKQELLEEIKLWGEGEPPKDYVLGVCRNVVIFSNGKYRLDELVDVADYPNFSDDYEYPLIDSDNLSLTAEEMYTGTYDMWHKGTAYGQERRKFCLWVYEEGMKVLVEENSND